MGEALQRRICLPVSSIIMNHLPSCHSNEYPILLDLMFYFILIGPPKNGWNLLAWNKKNKTSTWTPTNPNLKKDGSAASPNLPDFGMAGFAKTAKKKKTKNNSTTGGTSRQAFQAREIQSTDDLTRLRNITGPWSMIWCDVYVCFLVEDRKNEPEKKVWWYIMQTKTKPFWFALFFWF